MELLFYVVHLLAVSISLGSGKFLNVGLMVYFMTKWLNRFLGPLLLSLAADDVPETILTNIMTNPVDDYLIH